MHLRLCEFRKSEDTTFRNVVYRLLPGDAATGSHLLGIWDACRFTWNEVKEAREIQYSHACGRRIESPTFFTLGNAFKVLWDQTDWLREYSYSILRYTLKYQADAWKAFLDGRSGYPKWKSRYSDPSFTIPENVRIKDGRLAIPKVAGLSIRRRGGNPYPDGKPVKAVIRKTGKRWEAVVCYEIRAPVLNRNGRTVGVDRNAGQVADSDGEIHRLADTRELEAKVRRHHRLLQRKKRGSKRREKQKMRVARAHRRLRNARRNWQHHVSKRIAEKAQTLVLEKLNTRSMTASARGTNENPGRNVRQKAGLNRVILKTGWAALKQMFDYKASEVIEINPAYTSQTCSACGIIDANSRCSQSEFVCVACGHAQNADLNAARNILASGTGAAARRGAFGLPTPMTREMDAELARVSLCI